MTPMVPVRDAARCASLSTTTVSHVLNGTRFFTAEFSERVGAAVEDLDYQPNAAARSLTRKRSNTVGFLVSDIRNPFFASVERVPETSHTSFTQEILDSGVRSHFLVEYDGRAMLSGGRVVIVEVVNVDDLPHAWTDGFDQRHSRWAPDL